MAQVRRMHGQITATDTIVTGINFASWPTGVDIGSLANNTQLKGNYFSRATSASVTTALRA